MELPDNPDGAGESNIASSEFNPECNLRISFHRGSFENQAAQNRSAFSTAYVINDFLRDTVYSFWREQPLPGMKLSTEIQILLENTNDDPHFAEKVNSEKRKGMDSKSFGQAKQYVFQRLERELSPGLYYHSLEHTTQDVVPAAQRIAAGEGIHGADLLLLLTGAWFHDLGFIETSLGHEAVGARLAGEVLPGLGYDAAQIQAIQAIIMATVVPQGPVTILEQILADADLDVLGREDFWPRNIALRRELAFFGKEFTDNEWYSSQLKFISAHTYFTGTARAMREACQLESIALLQRALAELGG